MKCLIYNEVGASITVLGFSSDVNTKYYKTYSYNMPPMLISMVMNLMEHAHFRSRRPKMLPQVIEKKNMLWPKQQAADSKPQQLENVDH